jgi:hypothetical protein
MTMFFLNSARGTRRVGRIYMRDMLLSTNLIRYVIPHENASKSSTTSGEIFAVRREPNPPTVAPLAICSAKLLQLQGRPATTL